MSSWIQQIFENLKIVGTQSADALKEGFKALFYVGGTGTDAGNVSDIMLFVATTMGLTVGLGIIYKLFKLVRIGRR